MGGSGREMVLQEDVSRAVVQVQVQVGKERGFRSAEEGGGLCRGAEARR